MAFKDFREFISKLEEAGEAQQVIEEVDWNLEAGAMIRLSNEKSLPALFFQKVKGCPEGYRLFGEALSSQRRIAIAMEMEPDTSTRDLVNEYLHRKQHPIKPVLVEDGPCKENIFIGDDVDLLKFPVPMIHPGDGGRYIGTWHLTICKDLDSSWANWGMYRHMLHNKDTVALQAGPFTHVRRILDQSWRPRNKAMEIAIVIGPEPISTMCAASPIPYGISEADIAGGIRQKPMELVKCETLDLLVPASAEIVIEGEVALDEMMEEGPFGEFTGYMGGHKEPRPVIRVKAVTHRNDPILTMGNEGVPITNTHAISSITWAAEFYELLRSQGLPVTGVSEFVQGVELLAVVAVKASLVRADEVAHAIWGSRVGASTPWIIVVEDDVDPFNLDEVMHALVSKCHPFRGIVRLEHSTGMALIPWLSKHEQKYLLGSRAYFDCTWPRDWDSLDVPKKCSFKDLYTLDLQEKVLQRWSQFGHQLKI